MSDLPIKDMPHDKLARALVDVEAEIALLGAERKAILAELTRRFGDEIKGAYGKADKTHGKVTVKPGSVFELDAEVRQTVEWDQAKLMAASSDAETITPEEAQHVIKVELSVPEKIYSALPPGKLKTALTDARTTKLSAPSLKVRFPEEK